MVEKSKTIHFAVYLAMVILVLSLVLLAKNVSNAPIKIVEYPVFFRVDAGGVSFDVNNSLLTFGQINPGGGANRRVVMRNNYEFSVEVFVFANEDVEKVLFFENYFVIDGGDNRTVQISLSLPDDFDVGNYTGTIRFEMYKSKS